MKNCVVPRLNGIWPERVENLPMQSELELVYRNLDNESSSGSRDGEYKHYCFLECYAV
jgi:hypothetical protein